MRLQEFDSHKPFSLVQPLASKYVAHLVSGNSTYEAENLLLWMLKRGRRSTSNSRTRGLSGDVAIGYERYQERLEVELDSW